MVTKGEAEWVLAGVASIQNTCGSLTVYTDVSRYQRWIRESITGMEPRFVVFDPPGIDMDKNFLCLKGELLTTPATISTTGDTIFSGGVNPSHFTHFFCLSAFVLVLHAVVGSCDM